MAGRHRLAVLPGLSTRSGTASVAGNDYVTGLATLDEDSNNRQLVPLSAAKSNIRNLGRPWNGLSSVKSGDSDDMVASHIQQVTTRMGILEEANKAILEEVYRLQGNIRAADYAKKEAAREEKKTQRELMDTIRASNDIIGQLTSRLRKAEEKLHQERENVKNVTLHAKKLEQVLFSAQKEAESQKDSQNSQTGDLRHRIDDLARKWERNDRMSESIVDEYHQLKNRVDIQTMELSQLQSETQQRSKRTEDELKQTKDQARFQKDSNSLAEQNNLQLRHLLEARMAETRDAVTELRSRIAQTESDGRSQMQQLSLKITDLQSIITDVSHQRQEEMQSMDKSRQEQHHTEANERIKLQNKIQVAVEEMNEKLLQKEVRLREDAVKKFIDVEKLFRQEEISRVEFEKQLREETEARWGMQQRLYLEEIQAMKEMRRSDRAKQSLNLKKVDDYLLLLEEKTSHDRKALEKVLLAEIMKREVQTNQVVSQVDGVQEQLRIAISTMQQALGGVQLQASKDKEHLLSQLKTRLATEEEKLSRAVTDVDARLTAISMRLTQQDENLETKTNQFKQSMKNEHNQLLQSAAEWRKQSDQELTSMRDVLKELPQKMRETQERLDLLKVDLDTRVTLESESRLKDFDVIKKQTRQLSQQVEEIDSSSVEEKSRLANIERDIIVVRGEVSQLENLSSEMKSNLGVRINSESKMRLEETSAIKRDLARLRVDVQPLLWQHHALGRTFIKTPMSFLNEWGIYQCARWYDIKMRWLRLLDKSRKRGRSKKPSPNKTAPSKKPIVSEKPSPDIPAPSKKSPSPSRKPSPDISAPSKKSPSPSNKPSPDISAPSKKSPTASRKPSPDIPAPSKKSPSPSRKPSPDISAPSKKSPSPSRKPSPDISVASKKSPSASRKPSPNLLSVPPPSSGPAESGNASSEEDRPLSGDITIGNVTDEEVLEGKPKSSQPAWYNKDNVDHDQKANSEEYTEPAKKGKSDNAIEGQRSGEASLRQSSGESKDSQNSRTLNNKNGASPGAGSNNSNPSAGRRSKLMRSPMNTTSGGGQSFDMEGAR